MNTTAPHASSHHRRHSTTMRRRSSEHTRGFARRMFAAIQNSGGYRTALTAIESRVDSPIKSLRAAETLITVYQQNYERIQVLKNPIMWDAPIRYNAFGRGGETAGMT